MIRHVSSACHIVARVQWVQFSHVHLLHAWMFGACLSKLCQLGLGPQEYEVNSPAVDLPSSIFAPKKEEFQGEILHYSYVPGDSSERASPLRSSSTSGSTAEPAAGTPVHFECCDSNSEWRQSCSLKGSTVQGGTSPLIHIRFAMPLFGERQRRFENHQDHSVL